MNTPKTIEVISKYTIDIDNKTCTCNSYQYTKNIPKSCKHLDDYITNTKVEVSNKIPQQNTNTNMDLINASKYGQIDKVHALIAAGASIDLKDNSGWTALMWASASGKIDCVNALIAAGASIDLKNKYGETALIYASSYGQIDCVNALIAAGASIDFKDKYGKTALMLASIYGHIDCVNALKTASEKSQKSSNTTPAEIPAKVSKIDARQNKTTIPEII